jgi:hypothetical protein
MINKIKKDLKSGYITNYWIKVKKHEVFQCQNFLIRNGFLWNSGIDNLNVENIPIKYYKLFYIDKFKILYSTENIDFVSAHDIIVYFKDLVKKNFKLEKFIDDLFKSI